GNHCPRERTLRISPRSGGADFGSRDLPPAEAGRRLGRRQMNCAEASATGQAYVDGELDGVDREAVERHLVGCPGCARRVHVQTRFRAAVRAHLHRPEVPFTLRRRIEESLGSQQIAPRRWPAWMSMPRIVPAAAAVFLIV